ncbi:MAG TPA: molybdopterin cofactor-binding domain-containing protein, partial [Pirellulales bacterium]|nr:molybdopterin cofactor-binding domain-containing protein [Pirellulales bacterium]
MAEYSWPKFGTASVLGKETDRIDGLVKATGAAKYSYDINRKGMLFAKMLGCPHAHCKIKAIDASGAAKLPGVRAVKTLKEPGNEIRWQGDALAIVAADTEAAAAEALKAVKVEYEMLEVYVDDEDLAAAEKAGRAQPAGSNTQWEEEPDEDLDDVQAEKEIDRLLKNASVVVEGYYGINVITHMCLEPHGSTCEWKDDKLIAHLSTQNVSGTAGQFADPLKITADDVEVHCDFIGGGFGSKFAADAWGVAAAEIAKETGRPVKLMLDRDQELKVAGNRPSGFLKVKVGADKDGVVTVWDSHHWGTSGAKAGGISQTVIPYVFDPKNRRRKQTAIVTDTGPDRAWRAPNHPQAAAMTQTAYDDIAAKLGIDSYDVFLRNLPSVSPKKGAHSMADTYREQMEIAAKLIDWKAKWHPHGKGKASGSIVTGLGMALHTWGGGGHNSSCLLKIHPDGGVETSLGSQDLGTGTRTAIAIVVAETFGLPVSAVKVNIGSSRYPNSGPSGGSTTIGGVSESNRRASQDALRQLNEKVAKKLGVEADSLVAKAGRIQVADDSKKSLSWKEACSLLGMNPLEVTGKFAR